MIVQIFRLWLAVLVFGPATPASAEIVCVEGLDGKPICVDVGSGKGKAGGGVIGSKGGCGKNSGCGTNQDETQDKSDRHDSPPPIALPKKSQNPMQGVPGQSKR